MTKNTPSVKHLKLLASKLTKSSGLSRSQSLDKISMDHGFKNWRDFKLIASKSHELAKDKVEFYNYDPSIHDTNQIQGLETNHIQITHRAMNLVSDNYPSLNSFRHQLDKDIKNLKSLYKDRMLFCIHIYISSETAGLMKDQDKFFQAIIDRERKIYTINKIVTDRPPSPIEMESTISEFNSYFDSIFKGL